MIMMYGIIITLIYLITSISLTQLLFTKLSQRVGVITWEHINVLEGLGNMALLLVMNFMAMLY